jgi:hypothetical protein
MKGSLDMNDASNVELDGKQFSVYLGDACVKLKAGMRKRNINIKS